MTVLGVVSSSFPFGVTASYSVMEDIMDIPRQASFSRSNGRATEDGYSLRKSLEDQGVTTEEDMRLHMDRVGHMLLLDPTFDVTRYRVKA